jgi:hypothetical protein
LIGQYLSKLSRHLYCNKTSMRCTLTASRQSVAIKHGTCSKSQMKNIERWPLETQVIEIA